MNTLNSPLAHNRAPDPQIVPQTEEHGVARLELLKALLLPAVHPLPRLPSSLALHARTTPDVTSRSRSAYRLAAAALVDSQGSAAQAFDTAPERPCPQLHDTAAGQTPFLRTQP
jgi:hypothetical protein